MANVGRLGILYSFLLFLLTLYNMNLYNRTRNVLNYKRLIGVIIIVFLLIVSASAVKALRGADTENKATSQELKSLHGNFFINPSIYIYISGHIGAFSKYLDLDYDKKYLFGNTSLRPIYNISSKFGLTSTLEVYPKGYNIPLWHNTGTYLMDLHQDYGTLGLLLIPFLLGYSVTKIWFLYYIRGNLIHLLGLCYF